MSSRLVEAVLAVRGLTNKIEREAFLHPSYEAFKHDPFLLPDMQAAVERLVVAKEKDEQVAIYGDYDIDGLTATTVLLDSFEKFGIRAHAFIPNRFVEGYGLSSDAIERLVNDGAQLIVTVDCGSLSHKEIEHANKLGADVIVTDHHSVAETMPAAVATINPKRPDHGYPFIDLAGVGVAFKLVQALQTKLDGLPIGHEKWLLDLVALGTVCDVVELKDENRANVYWGLEVMKKTRRPGIRALMAVAGVMPTALVARSLGFGLGPRLNAAGRLETARLSLDLLTATDGRQALTLAQKLDIMNTDRRTEQDRIFKEAIIQADSRVKDPVLIVSDPGWCHGIIGIVAAKLLERYYKPTFVLQELEDGTAKGSARSFGEFSAVDAIRATDKHLIKGGGHKFAAGVSVQVINIDVWRDAMGVHYRSLKLENQNRFMEPTADVSLDDFSLWNEQEIMALDALEPYGMGNAQPIMQVGPLTVIARRTMGTENQHVKYSLSDNRGEKRNFGAFNAADKFTAQPGDTVRIWAEPSINEWRGVRNAEGRLIRLIEE
jgi:single-stranded-DNA-specific exonuclease